MSVSVVHTGKWTTIGEPVLDLKINRAWKSNAQLRREADAAAGQSSDDRYTRAALGHRHTQSEHVTAADTGKTNEEQLKTKTAPKQIEHVVPLMQHLKTHRAEMRKVPGQERNYAYLRDNIKRSENRMRLVQAGVSLHEILKQDEGRVKELSELDISKCQPAPPATNLVSSLPMVHSTKSANPAATASDSHVFTFGGIGTVLPAADDRDSASNTLAAFSEASVFVDRQLRLQKVTQLHSVVPLPADIKELMPRLVTQQQQQQERLQQLQEKTADAVRSATLAPPASSVVVFSPPTETGLARIDIVDILHTSRAALAEPLYAALHYTAPPDPQSSPRSARLPRQPHPPGSPKQNLVSTRRPSAPQVAPPTAAPASYRRLKHSLDSRLKAANAQDVLDDEDAERLANQTKEVAGSKWDKAQAASVQKVESMHQACEKFDARKTELGRSLTAMVTDMEIQRANTLQRKLVATQGYAFNSLAADLSTMREETDRELRRLLAERTRNYIWFDRLVRKLTRGSRELTHPETVLLLHIRSLIESAEGFYIHPNVAFGNTNGMPTQTPAAHDPASPPPPESSRLQQRRNSVTRSFSHASLHLPSVTADWNKLEHSMLRVLQGALPGCIGQKEIVEVVSFLSKDVFRLDNHRFRACLETLEFDERVDELMDLYALNDRDTRKRAAEPVQRSSRRGGVHTSPSPPQMSKQSHALVPTINLAALQVDHDPMVSPRIAQLRARLTKEHEQKSARRQHVANAVPLKTDQRASTELAQAAHRFAAEFAQNMESVRTCLPQPHQRYMTAARSARMARIDNFVEEYDVTQVAPPLSARAAHALPKAVQATLSKSLGVYVAAVREQRRPETDGDEEYEDEELE